jgi:UDP-N-acetylmuramyl tripeptide synthase
LSSVNSYIVLEVDEACFEAVVVQCFPSVIVITNLGRDQLDRFGEVDCISEYLQAGIRALSANATAVLNADDPNVVAAAHGARVNVRWYGCAGTVPHNTASSNLEARSCPRCRSGLFYTQSGFYCSACDFASPQGVVRFDHIVTVSPLHANLNGIAVRSEVFGTAGAYNGLAAITAATEAAGASITRIAPALSIVAPPLGRGRTVLIDEVPVTILLSKNPSSFAMNLIELTATDAPRALVIAVNDRDADGRDVSWLWDVPFESLNSHRFTVAASGARAADVAVRLKYANVPCSVCSSDVLKAIREVGQPRGPASIFLCCTYSVLLDLWKAHAIPSLA